MNWSTCMYVFGQEKEDGYAKDIEKPDAGTRIFFYKAHWTSPDLV